MFSLHNSDTEIRFIVQNAWDPSTSKCANCVRPGLVANIHLSFATCHTDSIKCEHLNNILNIMYFSFKYLKSWFLLMLLPCYCGRKKRGNQRIRSAMCAVNRFDKLSAISFCRNNIEGTFTKTCAFLISILT